MMIGFSDQKRFNKMYLQYHTMVRNVLYGLAKTDEEALEDLTQEAFIRIWKGVPRFAFRSSLETWIYRITVNTAIDYLRRKKSLNNLSSNFLKESQTQISEPVSYVEVLEVALDTLDEESRSIMVLFYFQELSIKKISRVLELPEGTVKSRMHKAKQKMKTVFSDKGVFL